MTTHLLPAIRDWPDWSAVFTDADLWRPAIEAVWAAEPVLAARTGLARIGALRAGYPGTCAVFILDETVVIKLFPPLVAGDFERERAVYRLLAGRVPEMPRLLAEGTWRDRVEWPYLVTWFLPGRAWREARTHIPPSSQLAIAQTLGERVGRVHRALLPAGLEWPRADAWPRFVAGHLPEAVAALRASELLPMAVAAECEVLLRATDWFDGRPCLLHADLTEDHALVERTGEWRLSGLLDWADAEVGDPTYEWVALYFGFCGRDTALFRAFMDGYGLTDGRLPPRRRLLAYTLLHRFGRSIIADALPDEARRQLTSLDELAGRLFPGLDD